MGLLWNSMILSLLIKMDVVQSAVPPPKVVRYYILTMSTEDMYGVSSAVIATLVSSGDLRITLPPNDLLTICGIRQRFKLSEVR